MQWKCNDSRQHEVTASATSTAIQMHVAQNRILFWMGLRRGQLLFAKDDKFNCYFPNSGLILGHADS
eukprot:scaffold37274_cov18-Tisochrysis_lutea.AAC.1